jgi:TetR/AcrR family transcriptional repressor of nem operon
VNAKQDRRERSHAAIVAAACALLRQKGVAGTSVAEVMRGAGLTVGGFYAHFPSKEALIDEALRRTADAMRARLFARVEERPPEARAALVLKRYLSSAHRDDAASGCPLPAIVGEVSTHAPDHREALAEELDRLARELAAHLPGDSGAAKRARALGMIALMYGGLSLARAVRGTPLSDELLRAARAFGD